MPTPPSTPPRVPSMCVTSGCACAKSTPRAARISRAVSSAVPDGASTLPSWCSSITSTASKCGAAMLARCISSTAPSAKFDATTAPSFCSAQPRAQRVDALRGLTGGADHRPHAGGQRRLHEPGRELRVREVDHDVSLRVREQLAGIGVDGVLRPAGRDVVARFAQRLDQRDWIHVRLRLDGRQHGRAHVAGAAHHHADSSPALAARPLARTTRSAGRTLRTENAPRSPGAHSTQLVPALPGDHRYQRRPPAPGAGRGGGGGALRLIAPGRLIALAG